MKESKVMKHIHKGTSLTTCASIDIGLVNKYYDLAKSGDTLAAEHYRTLEVNAGSCIGCGHCDERCPFGGRQSGRMSEIRDYFN